MGCLVFAGAARADLEPLERNDARRVAAEEPAMQRNAARSPLFSALERAVRRSDKHLPELAISVATPGEASTNVPLAPLIPQTGLAVRLGVQWSF